MKLALYFLIFSVLVGVKQMPELLEIRFALSAAPPHLRKNATTYVLDPAKGYVLKQKGANGISCIVVRSDWHFPGVVMAGR